MPDRNLTLALGLTSLALPFAIYAFTAAPCVAFDDAAEFTCVADRWSVAHPPGFPAWTALAHAWLQVLPWLDPVRALNLYSAALGAGAVALTFAANRRLLAAVVPDAAPRRRTWAAFFAAMGAALGATVWQWSNAVEVYAFQGFCTALLWFAITLDPRPPGCLLPFVLVGVPVGLGLANHSLTMLLLLPAALLMAAAVWPGFRPLRERRMLWSIAVAAAVFVLANGAMMLRARGQYPFEFDKPDTLRRWWHHVTGGFLGESFFREGAPYGSRLWFLLFVVLQHFWLFAIPFAMGLQKLLRKSRVLALAPAGYLAAILLLQAGRTMVANADSYLIPALLCCSLPVARGLLQLPGRTLLAFGFAAVLASAAINWRACDRSRYDAGSAWIRDFDASAPQRSVVLFTNWDQGILAAMYRDERGFRPDLVVLHSNVKGTNHECARLTYPDFVRALQPEYDAFLAAIAAVDPDYVFTDYYQIDTKALADGYAALMRKLFQVAAAQHRAVLMDLPTVALWKRAGVVKDDQVHPCGVLFSLGRQPDPPPFPASGSWWDQPFLMHDLCAAAMLRDYEVAAQQITAYWHAHGDTARAAQTGAVAERIKQIADAYRADKPFLGWRGR